MKILAYSELESKDELFPLMDHAFRWPFNQSAFENLIRLDPRLKNSVVGFCAVEKSGVLGYVGVMDLRTRKLDGELEPTGGIYGVATMPNHLRKGVCTALMNRAHEYFRERGYRFSFLGTGHSLVAHSLYEKLGYRDSLDIPSAYKTIQSKNAEPFVKEKVGKVDLGKVLEIYNRSVKGRTGLVVRDEEFLMMLKKNERLTDKQYIVGEEGYAIVQDIKYAWVNGILIRELVSSNAKEANRLLGLVERRARNLICDRAVLDDDLLRVYESRGYVVLKKGQGVIMAKPLTADASLKQSYGDKFYMAGLDFF
ncbi:GNAT family N-acetyltransferase [Candidatus Bathyarchaeota archaeon]|jgi:GNAT superfamily N-acetyltransferase|nr:GNAT family N-acetyltransferase [Candidatus Bathyarchaeota archaeon]